MKRELIDLLKEWVEQVEENIAERSLDSDSDYEDTLYDNGYMAACCDMIIHLELIQE